MKLLIHSPNFNGATVWEWISNYIPHFIIDVITYPLDTIYSIRTTNWIYTARCIAHFGLYCWCYMNVNVNVFTVSINHGFDCSFPEQALFNMTAICNNIADFELENQSVCEGVPKNLSQYHACWCPVLTCFQAINSKYINGVKLRWVLRNNMKCKNIIMFH